MFARSEKQCGKWILSEKQCVKWILYKTGNLALGDNGIPPPLFKSVRSDEYAWNAIFSKSTWYGDLKSDVYTIYRRYIGYAGGYMDDI